MSIRMDIHLQQYAESPSVIQEDAKSLLLRARAEAQDVILDHVLFMDRS